jgi:hypothetical protein
MPVILRGLRGHCVQLHCCCHSRTVPPAAFTHSLQRQLWRHKALQGFVCSCFVTGDWGQCMMSSSGHTLFLLHKY